MIIVKHAETANELRIGNSKEYSQTHREPINAQDTFRTILLNTLENKNNGPLAIPLSTNIILSRFVYVRV